MGWGGEGLALEETAGVKVVLEEDRGGQDSQAEAFLWPQFLT